MRKPSFPLAVWHLSFTCSLHSRLTGLIPATSPASLTSPLPSILFTLFQQLEFQGLLLLLQDPKYLGSLNFLTS